MAAKGTKQSKTAKTETVSRRPRREVTEDAVKQAIQIRENGGTWADVIEATGFNGAILRPHMADNGASVNAVTVPVTFSAKSIANARQKGMSWYAIADALDKTETECRTLVREAGIDLPERVYAGHAPKQTAEVKPAPKTRRKKTASKRTGAEVRQTRAQRMRGQKA